MLVKDLPPGRNTSAPDDITAIGDAFYFTDDYGHQLWRSDGTPAGTVQLLTIPSETT